MRDTTGLDAGRNDFVVPILRRRIRKPNFGNCYGNSNRSIAVKIPSEQGINREFFGPFLLYHRQKVCAICWGLRGLTGFPEAKIRMAICPLASHPNVM